METYLHVRDHILQLSPQLNIEATLFKKEELRMGRLGCIALAATAQFDETTKESHLLLVAVTVHEVFHVLQIVE